MAVTAKLNACQVSHTEKNITVTSPTGRTVEVTKERMRYVSFPLCHKLTRQAVGSHLTVELTNEEMRFVVEASKPATDAIVRTANEVAKLETHKINGMANGDNGDERRLNQMKTACETIEGDVYMLVYDIPTRLETECPNPSPWMWNYGFRVELSCWVLPQKGLDSVQVQEFIKEYTEKGCEIHVVPYAARALKQIRDLCRGKLQVEILRIHTSLLERLDAAHVRLLAAEAAVEEREAKDEQVSEREREAPYKTRDNTLRVILRESSEAMMAALNCARMFDETESLNDLFGALRNSLVSTTKSFNAEMMAKGRKPAPIVRI